MKASEVNGRAIHFTIDGTLTPPQTVLGPTDTAIKIGHGILREGVQLMTTISESEGFIVDIQIRQTVV